MTFALPIVPFEIPSDFVRATVWLDPRPLLYGVAHGWLSRDGALSLIQSGPWSGAVRAEVEAEVRHLSSDERYQIECLSLEQERVSAGEVPPELVRSRRLWMYVALAFLRQRDYDQRTLDEFCDAIYAEFDYPSEIEGLIRWMPPPPGQRGSREAMTRAWDDYLVSAAVDFPASPPSSV